jgi:uncharacterized damage-inducible protein DinB
MDSRVDPAWADNERSLLIAFLQYHRDTLAMKCDGLTPEQLVERSVPPSKMSLIGLVRHMADVERSWFRRVIGGESDDTAGPIFYVPGTNDDGEFDDAAPATVDADVGVWRAEMAAADIVIARTDLDTTGYRVRDDAHPSLRWVLLHLIEEYARHNGHADFLRERIDGATGE